MNTRLLSSAMLVITALSAGYRWPQASAAEDNTAAATPPGMRYEAHVNAGGVPPPSLPPLRAPAGSPNDAKSGEGLFSQMNCDGCHGGGATGWEGPSLVDGRWRYGGADEEVFQSIFYGRPKGMPAYGSVLGADGVWMIVSYLKSQPVPAVVPTTNFEALANAAAPEPAQETTAAAGAGASAQAQPTDPSAKLGKYGCAACHAVDRKIVGPALSDVAAKYHDQAGAEQRLQTKVKNGGSGVWGDVSMPPNPTVPDADLREIIHWILTSPDLRK